MMNILISGAGIAGSTLAYWLARHGMNATVVERSAGQRSSGSPVDVRGHAVEVAERMGVLPRLREAATRVNRMTFVDAAGRRVGGMRVGRPGGGEVELRRTDLAGILTEAARDHAEYVYGDSIASLTQDGGGVDVAFDRGTRRRFDLVVGADGLHSNVRRLAFGAESRFVRHLGLYVATLPFTGRVSDPSEVVMYNAPGRSATLHPSNGEAVAAFIFHAPTLPGFDHRDTEQHRRLLHAAYREPAWRLPELMEQVATTDDLFFDAVSRVRLDTWSAGRVTLVGDAASSVSLFGDGSTLAMSAAYTLAEELAADVTTALTRYEHRHRTLADPRQRHVTMVSRLLIPKTRYGLTTRNLLTRLLPTP
ncbi:FAD-dependent monooxygenase [Nonomuraea endophytica]|uniref:2-polyprenyl-6-methoxyphenol hydroxylase-like FAD-dependent oxidoreductase n=1 Tax=Nonomuraea endophytica TaxID=714136 RepID=A0A7W7ZZB4_9ACTN|nr:FAD-dependent monooxygenase [Nonomuraea endophytica]MBB5076514.1 2-polyprenyl-6-methoxyphenol hydroxylase-like FAD-dependent oxidoreductase [Nonomuraea endophytica]